MNEVAKIHLGRQAFTISVIAQKELRAYLDAIAKQVEDADVTNEVELRMAELLTEHGVTGDKVILPSDIDYIKEQLGAPKDFKEDDETRPSAPTTGEAKRLFRDPENAWIAGVASGLAAYFGIDVLLIRVLFVLGTLAWGGSILVYIALWLLVPEAKTSSDRLQMAGTRITVDSLKEVVKRADVKGAAQRANDSLAGPAQRVRDAINSIFRLLVKLVGIGLTLGGLLILVGLSFGAVYLMVHGNIITDNLFPVGFREHVLVYMSAFVATMMAFFVIVSGVAVFQRKWPVRAWLTGVLVSLTLIGMVGGGALAADTAPKVRDRYNAALRTVVRPLPRFSSVNVYGKDVTVDLQTAESYSVSLKYFDGADADAIRTTVVNGVLNVDSQNFDTTRHCSRLCLPNSYDMVITINAPQVPTVGFPNDPGKATLPRYMQPVPVVPYTNEQ